MYQIVIDRSLCSGFGVCADLATDVIEVGADGIASLRVGSSADPNVLEAAAQCQMGAISVFEQEAA